MSRGLGDVYNRQHYSIQAAAKQDYEAFYQEEMAYRMLMDYPPAAHMLSVLASGEDEKLLEQGMAEGVVRKVSIPIVKMMLEATVEQFFQRDILITNQISYNEALEEVVNILVDGITR